MLDLEFSPDGNKLAAVGRKGLIIVWDIASGEEKLNKDLGFKTLVVSVAMSSATDDLLVNVGPNAFMLLEYPTGRERFSIPFKAGYLRFSRDGKQVVSVPYNGKLQYRDVKDGSLIRETTGRTSQNFGYALSPDCTMLALNQSDGTIRIRRLDTEKDVITFKAADRASHFSPSGKLLACLDGPQKNVIIWKTKNGEHVQTIKFKDKYTRIAISPDDKWLATAIWSKENQLVIHEIATGKQVLTLQRAEGQPLALAFSSKGSLLAVSSDRIVQVWELSEQKGPPVEKKLPPEKKGQ